MKKDLILDLAEDLIDEDRSTQIDKKQKAKKGISSSPVIASTSSSNIQDLIMEVAKILEMPMDELRDWVEESSLPDDLLKAIMKIAKRFKLNPVFGHIAWELDVTGDYEVYIPIDGWITLIHRQPTLQGIAFSQSSDNENGIPIWVECAIYRSDLTHPITVREYYAELKTDHPTWQQMPRRMLRHKTLQQCARLAFGINIQELKKSGSQINQLNSNLLIQKNISISRKNLLKEKLQICKI
jgi:hypothetical protein